MYGSINDDNASTAQPLLPAEQGNEHRRRASQGSDPRSRMRRQKTKRKLKEIQQEQPVFRSLFDDDPRKVKEHHVKRQQQQQQQSVQRSSTVTQRASNKKSTMKHKHSFLYSLLSPYSNKWQAVLFKRFISIVIVTDLILFILSTDPNIPNNNSSDTILTENFFHVTEGIASTIFLIEYVLRLYCITEKKKYGEMGPIRGRLAYMVTWPALLDLLATLPFFLEIPTGLNLPTLTYLRFFRLFRILKTDSYMRAMDAVYRVVYYNREILTVATLLCVFLVLSTSVLLYLCRPPAENSNNSFDSIGDTLYIATLMLTGQGGPEGDLPWYTKAVVLLTAVFSVAMFAIPASMLTWGFEAEAERMARRARRRALQEKNKKTKQSSSSSSRQQASARSMNSASTSATGGTDGDDEWESSSSLSSSSAWTASDSDGDTTDEEYFKLIAGEDDDDGSEEEEDPWMKQIREDFALADSDMDGTLTLKEFLKMQFAARNAQNIATAGNMMMPMQSRSPPQAQAQSKQPKDLAQRLETLEAQTTENTKKLDRILTILESKKSSKRW